MKTRKKYIISFIAVLLMIPLIFDAKTAFAGAADGIELCIKTVIPSLFPFFFLSGILNKSASEYSGKLLSPLRRLCGIPRGAEPILLLGFIGGYPIGAQTVASAYRSGALNKKDASRMLGFCNQAGPAFIFGIAGAVLEERWIPFAIWGILILSAILTGYLLPGKSHSQCEYKEEINNKPLESAIKAMASVCGWVILFRVILQILNRWIFWIIPLKYRAVIAGVLELTNGCVNLTGIHSASFRMIALTGMLSLGGICVGMQTVSAIGKLDVKTYFIGKVLQTVIATVLAAILSIFLFPGNL